MLSSSLQISFKKVSPISTGLKLLCMEYSLSNANRRLSAAAVEAAVQPSYQYQANDDIQTLDPLKHPDFFRVHELFTVKDLFDARVHYGHKRGTLDKRMKPFIYGARLGHLIFDLDKTAEHLREALNFTAHIAFRDGLILLVSKNPQATHLVEKTAKECKEFSYARAWKLGTFTDSTKKFGAVTRLPDLCIIFSTLNDVLTEHPAVSESAKMSIPTVAIVDTNCNPNLITFPVPGNDDSPASIELYCSLFKQAIMRGKNAKKKLLQHTN